jgi:hypothetical protein
MLVLVIAVNHQIQPARIKSGSTDGSVEAFEQSQKEAFGQMLIQHIRQRGVGFVGEEALHGEETIAERVCRLENCAHANIDMTPQERTGRGIPPGYDENDNLSEEERNRCHREREEYMCMTALARAGEAKSILLICGRLHSAPIAARLMQLGHSVETTDLQELKWYIENWAEHCMFNL